MRKFSKSIGSKMGLSILIALLMVSYAQAYTTGDTKTKYPIVLVPGVMGFDALFGMVEYFYKVADEINKTAYGTDWLGNAKGTIAYNVSVSAWKETYARGSDLKTEILKKIRLHYKIASSVTDAQIMANTNYKVNIIAHSHGSTTSRVAVSLLPNNIGSLTTVAGPHYGTPMPDYAITMNKTVVMAAIAGLNVAGNVIAIFSGRLDWLYDQNSLGVMNDFTQAGIKAFNTQNKFASEGIWKGGTYGKINGNVPKYGADATTPGAKAGNGKGTAKSVTDPTAILYYSMTGDVGRKWSTAWTPLPDVVDYALLVTKKFGDWYGYTGNMDAFVPVTSARFGEVRSESYYWNHCDEQNQTLGLLAWTAADPTVVYRNHAMLLKSKGR